ncbi:MAG: hypothetical protein GY816_04005, partial [Cytophagales bacterium]|nr:hypothetical protein [Cytophagales bacterium]
PKSQEFFSNIDPLYRTYGKQEALRHQTTYFENVLEVEIDWLHYNAQFRALSNWNRHAAYPFGDESEGGNNHKFSLTRSYKDSVRLHRFWRSYREQNLGYVNSSYPFRYQGAADINSYKMFLELCLYLKNKNGRVGIILPSSVHNDQGSFPLRQRWLPSLDLLIKFDNEKNIFEGLEHNSKFNLLVIGINNHQNYFKAAFFAWKDASVLET